MPNAGNEPKANPWRFGTLNVKGSRFGPMYDKQLAAGQSVLEPRTTAIKAKISEKRGSIRLKSF